MLTLGICTIVSDTIALDYHLEEFIKWHAPKVDKLVINVNDQSQDETLAVLEYMTRHYPSIEIYLSDWGDPFRKRWLGDAKLDAWSSLQTECKVLLDIDEFLDWNIDLRQEVPERDQYLWPINYRHYLGSWNCLGISKTWPEKQWRIGYSTNPIVHKHISTDDSGSNLIGVQPSNIALTLLHHYGAVRKRSILKNKWEAQMQRNYGLSSIATDDWKTTGDGEVLLKRVEPWDAGPSFFHTPEFERF